MVYTKMGMTKKYFYHPCGLGKNKEDAVELIRWCRRNFGERGVGWDFTYHRDNVIIEIWNERLLTMHEIFL